MLQELIQFDHQLFYWVNSRLSGPAFDFFFPAITDLHKTAGFKLLFVPTVLILILWRRRLEGLWIFIGGLLTVGLADAIGSKVIKSFFARPRPPLVLEDVIMRSPHFGGYSFTSNHASNMFCAAVFFGFFFPRARPWLLFFAVLVAYSRVYCGVHFPADVILGAAWGSSLGFLCAKAVYHLYYRFGQKKRFT